MVCVDTPGSTNMTSDFEVGPLRASSFPKSSEENWVMLLRAAASQDGASVSVWQPGHPSQHVGVETLKASHKRFRLIPKLSSERRDV